LLAKVRGRIAQNVRAFLHRELTMLLEILRIVFRNIADS
jgi:hypothetical protein